MTAKDYLNYLIETAKQNFDIKIQPSELAMLKMLLEKEGKL